MKLVISPAKSLDFESKLPTTRYSESLFLEQSKQINKQIKKLSVSEIGSLMKISPKLAELNVDRNLQWSLPFKTTNARQAVYAFNGDVYKGLDAYTISENNIDKLQNTVRILSGLYGILKPLDLIQPYRLEMGTKFAFDGYKNLYDFWKENITNALNKEMSANDVLVNLASNEYFKAIDKKQLKAKLVNIVFKEFKNGQYKTIAIFAKLARGLMARYIIDTNAKTIEDLKGFNYNTYSFSENMSSETDLVFIR